MYSELIDNEEFTMDKVAYMFEKIELNSESVLLEIGKLTEMVKQLATDVHELKKQVSEHNNQLLVLNKAIEWTVKYGGKIVGVIVFFAMAYQGIKKLIPHL